MLKIQGFTFNFFYERCYVAWDGTKECVIVDPGCERTDEKTELWDFVDNEGLKPVCILLTHGHLDHVYGVKATMERYGIPAMLDPREKDILENFNSVYSRLGVARPDDFEFTPVNDGDILKFGDSEITVISTPGHSSGGVCYYIEREHVIFTGDTLFAGSVGRTDNDFASLDQLLSSLRDRLMKLDGDVDVLPGHGPATSIARERMTNPFIYDDCSPQDFIQDD